MPSVLIQIIITSPLTIAIAILGLVLLIGILVLFLMRARAQRREQDALARERLIEMERVSQFAAAVDRVHHSHDPADVASEIAQLFQDHFATPALAIYAGRESDLVLMDLLSATSSSLEAKPRLITSAPTSVETSVLEATSRPRLVNLASLSRVSSSIPADVNEPQNAPGADTDSEPIEEDVLISGSNTNTDAEAILLPWRGAFQWNGLIAVDSFGGITAEVLEPFREPIARLTDKLAAALEFEDKEAALEGLNQHASRAAAFSCSVIACLEEKAPIDSIVRHVTELVDSDSAALWRMDDSSGMIRMVSAYGLKSSEFLPLPLGQGLAGNVAQSGEAMALEDAPADSRCIFPREARESGIASYMAAPLAVDGKMLGVIEAHTATRRTWTESERRALESAAAIITELIKTTDMSGDRLRVESAYLGLSEALQRLRSDEEVKEAVVEVLGHALGASRVIVVEFDEEETPQPVTQEYHQPTVKSAVGVTFTDTLFSRVSAEGNGNPTAISDAKAQSLMGPETAEELGVLSELILPIRVEGKTRAIIYVHQCDREREWDKEEIDFADRVVRQLSLSLANLRSLEAASSDAQKARADVRISEAITSALPEIVIGLDRDGRLNYFNAAAADKLELSHRDLQRAVLETQASAKLEQPAWESLLACENVMRLDSKFSVANQRDPVPVSVAAAPLRNENGEITGRVIVITELSHLQTTNVTARISELEKKLESYERVLTQSRAAEEEARGMLARASALEAKARAETDVTRRAEADAKKQLEMSIESQKQAQGSAQQLLEINRLKSEFIVNAGHEIEASLQSVLGIAELLEGGSYGNLTPEQREAVHGIYGWARRIKGDVDWLVEYGSARSRRLETSGAS